WKGVVMSDLVVTRGGGTTTPPVPPPIPGQGPAVARDPSYRNRLIDQRTGKPFTWVGKTAMGLAAQPQARAFIDDAPANGLNLIRVLVGAGKSWAQNFGLPFSMWPFLQNGDPDPAHFGRLDDVVSYAGQKGIAVELVLFECGLAGDMPDPTNYDSRKKA